MYDTISCTVDLPTGQTVSLYDGDVVGGQSAQTISYIAARDQIIPTAAFTTGNNPNSFERTQWSKDPVSVGLRCVNDPQNTDSCTCGEVVENFQNNSDARLSGNWATNTLADTNVFTRTFNRDGLYR